MTNLQIKLPVIAIAFIRLWLLQRSEGISKLHEQVCDRV